MMVYLIDGTLMYRVDDGAIWRSNDEFSTITLTVTMNRLLNCLIENKGGILSRDEILNKVWDAHGLISSNNTLNKYISELRKTFIKFGVHNEFIITIPKIGFKLNPSVKIVALDNKNTSYINETTPAIDKEEIKSETQHLGKISIKAKITSSIITSLLFIILAINTKVNIGAPTISMSNDKLLFKFDTCPVYLINKTSASFKENKKNIFESFVTKNKIACIPGSYFLYQPSNSLVYNIEGRIFLSRCSTAPNNKKIIIACLNYFWSNT